MEYDKWTRKYVGVLKEWGFEQLEKKATSHRKWRYSGPATERPVIVIVPAKIKNSSRAATIASVKRQLSRAGANRSSINRFDRIALGLIQFEASDTIDVLEDKLEEAISNKDHLIVAKIAFELGKRVGANDTDSAAIEKRQKEIDAEDNLYDLAKAIEYILLRRIQAMFSRQIEIGGPVVVGSKREQPTKDLKFEEALVDEFGFSINRTYLEPRGDIKIVGVLVGDLAKQFDPWIKIPSFSASIEDEDALGWEYCRDGEQILKIDVEFLFDLKTDVLQSILSSLEEEQTMMSLSGRLNPNPVDD